MKISTFVSGEKYQHMIKPFVNSASRFHEIHIFCTKEIKTDGLNVIRHDINFDYTKDKIKNLLKKQNMWAHIIKELGESILMDIDIIILDKLDLPNSDIIFTVDKRWSNEYDYINSGVFYSNNLEFMEEWGKLTEKVNPDVAINPPYMGVAQTALHQLIGFEKGKIKYNWNGLDIIGIPCDIYNHYNDKKLLLKETKVLHYKNRWQGGLNPSKERMNIIKKFI